jgi:inosine-uridine nucleoside N-ribohydrolase
MKILAAIFLFVSAALIAFAQPVKIIFDTDMAHDVDDVGALAILNHLSDLGECEILAVGISTPVNVYDGYYASACASVINGFYGRPGIPIGGYRGPYPIVNAVSRYVEHVAKAFPHALANGSVTEEAFRLYRRVLSRQPDSSVVIAVVGFLNNLEMLLDSPPDEISSLNGYDLVSRKVKFVSCMGGRFPGGGEEFNLNTYPHSALFVLSCWPTPVIYGGFELGSRVKCGKILNEKFKKEENPVAMAWYYYTGGGNRESWDELSALYAVRGCAGYFKLSEPGTTFFRMRGGQHVPNVVNSQNIWIPDPKGKDRYLLPAVSNEELGKELDKMLIEKPKNRE